MSFFKDIQSILDARLAAYLAVSGNLIDTAWENIDYIPILGTPFIRPTLLMSPSSTLELTNMQTNSGIYQIDLFYPLKAGTGAVLTKCDSLYDFFKLVPTLTSGTTTIHIQTISRASLIQREESWLSTNIEINFVCYK